MGLDPYERALYVHYKRVCGENQGAYCFEATKTTAQKVKMSTGQVSEARKQLAEKGLIIVQDGRPVVVTVVNIWDLNTAYYQLEHRPDVEGWTVEQVKLWLGDVHSMNISSHNDSNIVTRSEPNLTEDNGDVHPMNVNSYSERNTIDNKNMSSNVHTVKQRIEDSLKEESNPSEESKRERAPAGKGRSRLDDKVIPAFKVYVEITDFYQITKYWRGEMARIVGDKPEDLEFWRQVVIGWTGKYQTRHNVEGMLDYYKRREIPGYQPKQKASHTNGTGYTKRTKQPPIIPASPDKQAQLGRLAAALAADDT